MGNWNSWPGKRKWKSAILAAFFFLACCASGQNLPALIPYQSYTPQGYLFGLAKPGGETVVEGSFYACFPASDGYCVFVIRESGSNLFYGAVDMQGEATVMPVYELIGNFQNGLAPAKLYGGRCGYINSKGDWIIPPQFTEAGDFRGEYAVVSDGEAFGVCDRNGKLVVPIRYEEFFWPEDGVESGFAMVKDNGRGWGLLSMSSLTEVISCQYEEIRMNLNNGMVPVKRGGKWGFCDQKGKLIIPCTYQHTDGFSEGLAAVSLNGKFGYIDTKGRTAIPFEFSYAGLFREDVAVVMNREKGTWFWLNAQGVAVAEFPSEKYVTFGDFHEGRIRFSLRTDEGIRWGFMNREREIAIPAIYGNATDFSFGRACVSGVTPYDNMLWGLIDAFGQSVTKIRFSRLYPVPGYEGLLWYCESGKSLITTPLIDRNGICYFQQRSEE